jgi:hypothetical protein
MVVYVIDEEMDYDGLMEESHVMNKISEEDAKVEEEDDEKVVFHFEKGEENGVRALFMV